MRWLAGPVPNRLAVAAVVVLVAGLLPASAFADGDPASDVLLTQDYYTPYPAPKADATAALKKSVEHVFAQRNRIKVAVIATPADLGSVPSLFGKPSKYARFLAAELRLAYIGPLLIAMPSGFGIYDGGRSTAAEERVLDKLKADGSSASALTSSAAGAVDKLAAAKALRSKDVLPPGAYPQVLFTRAGALVALTYGILEDSERARDIVTVFAGAKQLAIFRSPLRTAVYRQPHWVRWRVPKPAPPKLRYCVRAIDGSGNRGKQICLPIKIK